MKSNKQFKQETAEKLEGFLANPASRTVDVIPDLYVHAAQCWALLQLPEEEQKGSADPQNDEPQAAEEENKEGNSFNPE